MLREFYTNLQGRMLAAPIGTMLGIVLLLGLIPAFVMGGLYVQRGLADVEVIDNELRGVTIFKQLKPLEEFVVEPAEDSDARRKEAADKAQQLQKIMAQPDYATIMQRHASGDELLKQLERISQGMTNSNALVAYQRLITAVGDQSGLILDPALDTYYLMTISLQESYNIEVLNHELVEAYADASTENDPAVVAAKQRLRDTTRKLRDAAVSAVEGSKYNYLSNNKFMSSINATIAASNGLTTAYNQDYVAAAAALHEANAQSWFNATYALTTLLEQRRKETVNGIWISLGISATAALFVIIFAAAVIMSIANGVRSISQRLHDLSDGDYISPVPGVHYRNDIGIIAGALEDFIHLSGKVDEERNLARQQLEETMAKVRAENEGLLAEALEQQRNASELERQTLARLATDLETQIGQLLEGSRSAANKMDAEAAQMAERSDEIKREASTAADVAADIRRSVGPVPQTVEAVAKSLSDYTQALSESNQLAAEAAKRVALANQRMGHFSDATSKAAAMLDLIKSVAQKTNMLALNASIEAVRVGEAGTGFQVVANEVKALALSTRDAAAEIAQQIAEMEGVNHEVADAFAEVMQVVDTLAAQSAEVSIGMNGQAVAMTKVQSVVAKATSELSTMVTNIETADRSATATQQRSSVMLEASRDVSENVGALDNSVRDFLNGIRNSQRKAA
jgi:methyl-accepting chemotaxis protein